MRFGPVALEDARGAVLAHSVPLTTGRLRKGLTLRAEHLDRLREAGITEVTVARLDPDDVDEDDAALHLAGALIAGKTGLRISGGKTGRANLLAEGPGIVEIDAVAIRAVNAIDPAITVATVQPWQRLDEGGMAATVKIIPYAVPGTALDAACGAGRGAMGLRTPVMKNACLIETRVADAPAKPGRDAMRMRVERLGMTLAPAQEVAHGIDAIADALRAAHQDLVMILTGSATSDQHDTAPEALRRAGGEVTHFGMPVDPGNLMFLGQLGRRPVIGLPGCARSAALNGADWVLERLACGVPVTADDVMAMGVGGLLKEIPQRGHPRRS